jgi:hypothetical protein
VLLQALDRGSGDADRSNPRWSGVLGARLRRGTEREGEGELEEVLTGGRDVEGRPESQVNAAAAGSVRRRSSGGAQGRQRLRLRAAGERGGIAQG